MRAFKRAIIYLIMVVIIPTLYVNHHEKTNNTEVRDISMKLSDDTTYYYQNNMYENSVGDDEKTALISKKTSSAANKYKTVLKDISSEMSKYYTKSLSYEQQRVYSQICNGLINYEEDISIDTNVISKENINDFITYITCTQPEIHNLSGNYGIYTDYYGYVSGLKMTYSRDEEQGRKEIEQLNEIADELVSNTEGMTDSEKLKYFHDHVVLNCDYDRSGSVPYSAYGCLVEHKAVCEGYSKAMSLLCMKAGIPCINVIGTATDELGVTQSHMWNMVQMNGKWYHFDVTWDDPKSAFGEDYIRYDYFNVDDEIIAEDHTLRMTAYMSYPSAHSLDDNYFVANGMYVYDTDDAQDIISNALDKSLSASDMYVRIKCQSAEKFEQISEEYFNEDNGKFFSLLKNAQKTHTSNIKIDNYSIAQNQKTLIITVQLKTK